MCFSIIPREIADDGTAVGALGDGGTLDDWAEIEMENDPDNSLMRKSKSQLVVADDSDKNATGAPNSPEISPRMHKVPLFGKVKARVQTGQTTADVEVKVPAAGKHKTVTVHARIIRNRWRLRAGWL